MLNRFALVDTHAPAWPLSPAAELDTATVVMNYIKSATADANCDYVQASATVVGVRQRGTWICSRGPGTLRPQRGGVHAR